MNHSSFEGRPAPLLFQANTRVWLTALSRPLGRPGTLDDVPEAVLDRLADEGFDFLYMLGVWGSGPTSREIAASIPELRREYESILPDLRESDICGSCFAVPGYQVPEEFGGDEALARLRDRLRGRGLRLMVDFVPNHVGIDHPWVTERPELLLEARREDLAEAPHDYMRLETGEGETIVAHGKDPYFPGWTDTVQLDYGHPDLKPALIQDLRRIAGLADGVRCDMAMLVLPEVFEDTWGREIEPFWPDATAAAREVRPGFVFLAEAYWNTQSRLIDEGFDYCYDKPLYDGLVHQDISAIRSRLSLDRALQSRFARFLENHDEERAAATFGFAQHRAAALLGFLSPGMRFLHQGQLEGYRIHVPMQLCRGPEEAADEDVAAFYRWLVPVLRHPALAGEFGLLDIHPAWDGAGRFDSIVAFQWAAPEGVDAGPLFVIVNYSPDAARCRIPLRVGDGADQVRFFDIASGEAYERDSSRVVTEGLHVDLPAWGYHVLEPAADR